MRNKLFIFEKKYLFILAMFVLMFLMYQTSAFAKDKDVAFTLEKDYEECVFTVTTTSESNFTVTIIAPDGTEYLCESVGSSTYVATVQNAQSGEWTAKVTGEDKIGKVKVSVTADNEATTEVTENIKVGKDIAGLNVYTKDNKVVATWTDTTIPSVSMTITDMSTNEVIDQTQTQDATVQELEIECPANTQYILASIVPTASISVDNSEITFAFDMNKVFDADIVFPSSEYTNEDSITATVTLGDTYGIYIEDNDIEVAKKSACEPGEYSIDIPLTDENENKIVVYFIDGTGCMKGFKFTAIKDMSAPTLTFDAAYDGATSDNETYTISGWTTGCDTLTINSKEVEMAQDGSFSYDLTLSSGANAIEVVAKDKAGNETIGSFTITYSPSAGSTGLFLIGAVVIIIILLVSKKRKKTAQL